MNEQFYKILSSKKIVSKHAKHNINRFDDLLFMVYKYLTPVLES